MRVGQFSGSLGLAVVVALAGSWIGAVALPGWAQEERVEEWGSNGVEEWGSNGVEEWGGGENTASLPVRLTLTEAHPLIHPSTQSPATTVTEWVAQIEASLVQITGVRVEATEAGVQIVLETAEGVLALPETRSVMP
jgi:iron complex outermembrane recepter protein